jgi:pimeloyl-ACP methyl ester carboxylesterase
MIFLHGWPLNHTFWKKELRYFQGKGYSTIAPDLRGHGKSDKPEKLKDYKFNKFAKDIDLIIQKEKVKNSILIGHSFGGMIALAYYSLFPKKVKAMILMDTIYENPLKHIPLIKYLNLTPFTKYVLKFIIKREKIKKKNCSYVDFSKFKDHSDFYYWLKGAKVMPLKSNLACLEEMIEFNQKKVLPKINIPTLIIEGSKDHKTPLKDVTEMAKRIKNSKLEIIKGASHDTNLRRPQEVDKIISKFINSLK